MKGIILAGGNGSRLYPITQAVSKQLLPIYDKPLIYYPLNTLLQIGINDILVISKSSDQAAFQQLLHDGTQWGIHIQYAIQNQAKGIAEALIIAADFIGQQPIALILGDNLFHSTSIPQKAKEYTGKGAMIFALRVNQPQRFGVLSFNEHNQVIDIIEKPQTPPSAYAVSGLYLLDEHASAYASALKPSARGELEITDIQRRYLQDKQLHVQLLPDDSVWFDTGTTDSLLEAAQWVRATQKQAAISIGAIEETVFKQGKINQAALIQLAQKMPHTDYGQYLLKCAQQKK